jgi:hypothetical protein
VLAEQLKLDVSSRLLSLYKTPHDVFYRLVQTACILFDVGRRVANACITNLILDFDPVCAFGWLVHDENRDHIRNEAKINAIAALERSDFSRDVERGQ